MAETELVLRQEITITELSRHSSKCVHMAMAGFDVVITDYDDPVVRLVRYNDEVKLISIIKPDQIEGLPDCVEGVYKTHPLAFLIVCQAFLRIGNRKGNLLAELMRLSARLSMDQLREVVASVEAILSPKATAKAAPKLRLFFCPERGEPEGRRSGARV